MKTYKIRFLHNRQDTYLYAGYQPSETFILAEGCALGAVKYPPETSAANKQSGSNIAVDNVSENLRQIVTKYPDIYNQPAQCEALLRDFCPGHNREIFILMAALKSRIVTDLLSYHNSVLGNVQKDNLADRLQTDCGFGSKDARWAVDSWDRALRKGEPDKSHEPKSNNQSHEEEIEANYLHKGEPAKSDSGSSSLLPNTISPNDARESARQDSNHAISSYSSQQAKTPPGRRKIILIIVAIVGAIIGFGALASLMNPSNDNDSTGGGSSTTLPTIPNVQPDTDLQPNLEGTTDDNWSDRPIILEFSSCSSNCSSSDNWSIVLE